VWLGWVGLEGVLGEEGDSVDADADERVIVISAPMNCHHTPLAL